MLQSRRGFLIGAGSLLTAAFVSDARSFIRRTNQPLLASPEQIAQTLHWYDGGAEPEDGYTLTLGPWTMEPPPAPPWREFFISEGVPHKTEREIERICASTVLAPTTSTSRSANTTGLNTSSAWETRPLRHISCSKRSTLGLNLRLRALPFWNFMRATTIPAATTVGSTQRTNSRCPCCRRVSSISRCRSRSWKAPDETRRATPIAHQSHKGEFATA